MLGRRIIVASLALACAGSTAASEDKFQDLAACFSVSPCLGCQGRKLPIVVDRPGSYRLCRDLVVTDANTTAILVNADDVTIDLDGHTISGPSAVGSGVGISAGSQSNLTVLNGTVRGMGASGIVAGRHARIQGVKAIGNGGYGIEVGTVGLLTGNLASENGRSGLSGQEYTSFKDNVAHANAHTGIATGCACSVIGNLTTNNGVNGISTGGWTACVNNTAAGNAQDQLSGCGDIKGSNVCNYAACP
jgi:hypothetical protein